jgi:predicted ATPase
MTTAGMAIFRATRATVYLPFFLLHLSVAYACLGQLDEASRCIHEAVNMVETTKERWCEAEVNRIAGEIALKSAQTDVANAEAYFQRALAIASRQQAESWELRACRSPQ